MHQGRIQDFQLGEANPGGSGWWSPTSTKTHEKRMKNVCVWMYRCVIIAIQLRNENVTTHNVPPIKL